MQNTAATRKRPAPGASPMVQQPQTMPQNAYQYQQLPDNTESNNFDFANTVPTTGQPYAQPTNNFDSNQYNYALNQSQPQAYGANNNAQQPTSTDLVRRARNQQLVTQNNGQEEQWDGYANMSGQVDDNDDDDEKDLDAKIALAKKDASGKRKNILPFVQKLSSFLDSNNTDLIRWSDDGRSFIVLDEDEFARTLIPEVFKHNNYASFVRQLNMYGFHKTVNITDGSLRQSEKARKGVKPPSMYSHPYFRRNRPDLLWLVQKPAGGSKATKRKRDGGYDSDEGRSFSPIPETGPQQLGAPGNTNQDLAQLPRNELVAVRRELQGLQTQQRFISQMITQLKDQNDQFYRQATAFQALHDRHENSINAILTFLATFYRPGLEAHGAQNLVNMFTNATQPQQQHGSVVEEYNESTLTPTNQQVQRYVKRPPLLLPGPEQANNYGQNLQPDSAVTEPSSTRASASPPSDTPKRSSNSSTAHDSARTPQVKNEVQTPSQAQMMDLINNVNATTQASTPNTTTSSGGAIDMNSIVDRMNQNNNPLTPQQRDDMVNSVLGAGNNNNNALTSFKNANTDQWKEQLDQSHNALDHLQQLQRQQNEKVQELNRRLQPLSPTGTIPGLHEFDGVELDPFDRINIGAPGEYDPNAFINFDEPQPWETGQGGDFGFDFGAVGNGNNGAMNWDNLSGDGDMFGSATLEDPATNDNNGGARSADDIGAAGGGGRIESVSGSETTSPATRLLDHEPGTPSKRARRS